MRSLHILRYRKSLLSWSFSTGGRVAPTGRLDRVARSTGFVILLIALIFGGLFLVGSTPLERTQFR